MLMNIPTVNLQNEPPINFQLVVLLPTVRAGAAEHFLVPPTALWHVLNHY